MEKTCKSQNEKGKMIEGFSSEEFSSDLELNPCCFSGASTELFFYCYWKMNKNSTSKNDNKKHEGK